MMIARILVALVLSLSVVTAGIALSPETAHAAPAKHRAKKKKKKAKRHIKKHAAKQTREKTQRIFARAVVARKANQKGSKKLARAAYHKRVSRVAFRRGRFSLSVHHSLKARHLSRAVIKLNKATLSGDDAVDAPDEIDVDGEGGELFEKEVQGEGLSDEALIDAEGGSL